MAVARVRSHPWCSPPWWARPMIAFVWSILGWAWAPSTSVLGPDSSLEWAFAWFFDVGSALRFLDCAFLPYFPCILCLWLAKHLVSNTCGNMSIVKAYVSKVCLFLLFWILIGGWIWSIRTANNKDHGDWFLYTRRFDNLTTNHSSTVFFYLVTDMFHYIKMCIK